MNNFDQEKAHEKINKHVKKMIEKNNFNIFEYSALEFKAIKDIQTVLEWTDKKQIIVDFYYKDGSKYFIDSKTIQICNRSKFEIQLYSLLHECGHYLIDESALKNPKTYFEKFPHGYLSGKSEDKDSIQYKISILAEEIEAWNRGFSLSQRLGIKLNDKIFERDKNRALKSYIQWAAK